jgi:prevent-host-death family protein
MTWNIANAKQQFSEVVRLCAEEPQPVFNRSRPVAVVISAEDFKAFEAWRQARQTPERLDLKDLFGEAREALRDVGCDGLDLPARADRPGADLEADAGTAAPLRAGHATE